MKQYLKINLIPIIVFMGVAVGAEAQQKRPNILFCIADDASWQHMGAYNQGHTAWVKTPNFDRVANEGLLFDRAYTPNAKCGPSRSSIITGRNSWQLEEAANHNAYFPAKFTTFVEALGENGYFTGMTGKGWSPGVPGKYPDGSPRLLTGKVYNDIKLTPPTTDISPIDYPENFRQFLKDRPDDQPFFFWYGGYEPHRGYEYESGIKKGGKKISDITEVPPFWVDNDVTKTDMLDYAFEVEYFDMNLGKILQVLEETGELNNTLIVVTSDNGMPFPRIKGHLFEYDNHLPLAIMWKGKVWNPGRSIDDFVSFIDFAPTFLELADIPFEKTKMQPIEGRSIMNIITSKKSGNTIDENRDYVLLGREREDVGRPHDQGYPVRAIVRGDYIYSRNYAPDRWPSGNPETGYTDTDGSPTKTEILKANRKGESPEVWQLSFGKRPGEELYHIKKDPHAVYNLAYNPVYQALKDSLLTEMEEKLRKQEDPRMFGRGFLFDNYPYSVDRVKNLYERFMSGEKMKAGWINETDYEKF